MASFEVMVAYLKRHDYLVERYEWTEDGQFNMIVIARKPWQLPGKEYYIAKIYNKEIDKYGYKGSDRG